MTFLVLLLPPLIAAMLAAAVRPYRPAVGWLNALLSLVSLGAALRFAALAVAGGKAQGRAERDQRAVPGRQPGGAADGLCQRRGRAHALPQPRPRR
ncbi:MAG: hypothetical protein WCI67_03470 [Chloroflexales bacterium]